MNQLFGLQHRGGQRPPVSTAYITQTRKRVYQKLFNKKGRADELDEYILSLP